jgi:hypothetical protein
MHLVAMTTFTHQQYCTKPHLPLPGTCESAINYGERWTFVVNLSVLQIQVNRVYTGIMLENDFFLNNKRKSIKIYASISFFVVVLLLIWRSSPYRALVYSL